MNFIRFFLPLLFAVPGIAQAQKSPLVLAISSATLYPEDQRIIFTLTVKNNSDSAVYFLKPDQSLFEHDVEPEIPAYRELSEKRPYVFNILTAAECGDAGYGDGGLPARELQSISPAQLIRLHPDEARIFVGLTATFDRQFCEAEDYTLQLVYRVLLSDQAPTSQSSKLLGYSSAFETRSNTARLRLPH